MNNINHSVGLRSASTDNNFSQFVISIMSSIKHKKVHPTGVATLDQYFEKITEEVAKTFKKEEDDESSSKDSFYYNYSNYYNYYKTLFITITMINMKTSSIKLMSNQKTEKVSTFKPYIKASEFPEGVIKTFYVVKIVELEQEFQGVKKMEDITKVNLETGEETQVTQPVKGYELTLVDVDDKEQVARLLSVNAKAGVQFVDQMVENRSKPIGTFIAGEKIELEKVQNDFGYNPSILPVGA